MLNIYIFSKFQVYVINKYSCLPRTHSSYYWRVVLFDQCLRSPATTAPGNFYSEFDFLLLRSYMWDYIALVFVYLVHLPMNSYVASWLLYTVLPWIWRGFCLFQSDFIFLGYIPRMGIAKSYDSSSFIFLRNLHIVLYSVCASCFRK